MKSTRLASSLLLLVLSLAAVRGQVPDNLVSEPAPAITAELKADVGRYLEFRTAGFSGWHPLRREMLISTRFADSPQLHLVKNPGGTRRQLSFTPEPVAGGSFDPLKGDFLLFSQDRGGGEFFQLYRLDLADGRVSLLTDGKSRNQGGRWSNSGELIVYSSTRRTGRDTDLYVMNPRLPGSERCVLQVQGGGWRAADWSPDDKRLLVGQSISANESRLFELELATGTLRRVDRDEGTQVSYSGLQYDLSGQTAYTVSDRGSEEARLVRLSLKDGAETPITEKTSGRAWDVEGFDLSRDGKYLAYVVNQEGSGVLHLLDTGNGRELATPKLPPGTVEGVHWHRNSRDLGFTLSSAKSPSDAWSLNVESGLIERWTESETGGLVAENFVEPELLQVKSFDGLGFSAFIYRPDPAKFPGPRPAIINIHGGPEGQSRPGFLGRNNYFLNELGVALVFPNVRGSSGYGKTFLTLDNGFKREDSVKDIGALLEQLARDPAIARDRLAVMGGSYGGYMVLASLVHYGDKLRCGVDVVGISNFLSFLKNTQDYRRDLRRVEYGDEREPAMAEHLAKISPLAHVDRIVSPLFVIQGLNDPRVPVTEAEQMVKALRERGGKVWYLMAKDEGHGFRKKKNSDYQFYSTLLFLQENLLKN